ncbi:MAG: hypothetical protein MMC33_004225 [Icmadophila ericetorum]|nr:hypothetical protein [Icmadophila ericetorum]
MDPIDIEKQRVHETSTYVSSSSSSEDSIAGTPTPDFTGFFGSLRYYEQVLDRKFGVESQGPARVLPEERTKPNQLIMFCVWASGTMNLSCFATGFLGFDFGLSLRQNILVIIFATVLGAMVTGWCATMGPETGLRQVSISRYSLGWWPSKIIALLNVVEQLGWSSVGCITGGLALNAVSNGNVSLIVGVVIIAVAGLVFSFIGLRGVFVYEQFAWMVFLVIFLVIYGETARFADNLTPSSLSGATLSGTVLTLFAIIYGSSASWCSIVSDYYVQYPVDTNKWTIFLLTTAGITIPTCVGMLAGACVGSTFGINQQWADAENEGLGWLIQYILYPNGFAKFILVLLVLSGIGANCIAMYSAALSVQQFARPLALVPRFIWTLFIFGGILALGIAGKNQLLVYLEDFLSLLGYWNTAFFVIVFTEHYLFRSGSIANYDLTAWNTPEKMPVGYAGLLAFLLGIVGCILGMQSTWYTGVIAKMIGDYGGDIGNELAFAFTLISFPPLRYLERKYTGR